MTNPNGPNSDPNWQTVHNEMVQELGYVATVRGWFDNNLLVLNNNYNRSANLLGQAQSDVNLADSTSVVAKWLEFAADIVSGIAGFLPEGGQAIDLIITILKDTYDNVAGLTGDIEEQIAQIYTDLDNQRNSYTGTNATQQAGYPTDYSKLQQIGQDPATGGYDWSNATLTDISSAENGAAHGMLINFYRTLIPSVWQVLWCTGSVYPNCPPTDTPQNYDCSFGVSNQGYAYNTQAYISTGPPPFSPPLNWGLADKLTGILPNELNAIWYMMLLGGDAGWDLAGQQLIESGGPFGPGFNWTPDPLILSLPMTTSNTATTGQAQTVWEPDSLRES